MDALYIFLLNTMISKLTINQKNNKTKLIKYAHVLRILLY